LGLMRAPKVTRLGDEFGDYVLTIRCRQCRHTRIAEPKALACLAGWEITLTELATRLRCTECGAKDCELTAHKRPRPRGKDFR
jgi:ribosomal protein S27E